MVVKVRGKRAAHIAATIMQQHTGVETRFYRGEEGERVYWISNTYLEPLGEQEVLDRLPTGSLLYCAGCSHQRVKQSSPPVATGRRLSEGTKSRLRELASQVGVKQRRDDCVS